MSETESYNGWTNRVFRPSVDTHEHSAWTCYAHCGGCNPCDCADLEGTVCNPYFNPNGCNGIFERPPDELTCLAF